MVLLTSGAGRAQQPCDPPDARVVSIQGTVELRRAGTDVWTPAMLEEALCIGDALRVGQASRAALALANDSTVRLDQRTTLQLRGIAEEERSLLELLFGAVYFFSHRPRALEVDTPFVNAAAEGTEFLVRAGDDRAEVVMLDGQVLLRNPHGELRVASGDAALIPDGEAPAPMILALPRDAVAWALYYPPILAELAGRDARPRPLPAGLQAAIGRVAENDYAGALEALETVPEAARDARYHTYLAEVLLNVGRVEEAAAAIERALALDPEAGEALAQRAIIHVVQNRRQEALADARRAVELSPESSAARIALSYALQAAFQLEEARDVLREAAVQRNPDDALAWARLAELELMFGELGAARDAAEQAVALAPGLSRTQMVLGFAALTRIDIDQAKAAFERAIALDSAEPLARLGLGLARIRQSDLAEGRQEIEIAAALDPNDALIRSYLGKAYFEEKRGPLAGEQFAIAKELDPNDPTPWFYDAIRLQLDNRPVEALRSLERSIELNDNRAVYRSRLLLDEDRATREVSLARIYNTLGFEQVGLNEATKSLSLDPANYSAHRFLSDTYARLPRHEVARASELLQSQLLQPINISPVQPTLPITDLNLIAAGGPTTAAFNEYSPLFERNRVQTTLSGLLGNNNTRAGEVVVNGLYNQLSVSAGHFSSRSDGFRKNNDVDNDLTDFFAQAALTPKVGVQAEYRRRFTRQGDLVFNFDPEFIFEGRRRKLEQDTIRFGTHIAPLPNVDLIGSFFNINRHETFQGDVNSLQDKGYQAEGQVIFRSNLVRSVVGGGRYDIKVNDNFITIVDDQLAPITDRFKREQTNLHSYNYFGLPFNITATAGISYDSFEEGDLEVDEINPKLGLEWQINKYVRARAAAFRAVKRALVTDQTIEPTQVAGFNQFFDDFNGTVAWRYGVGLDVQLTDGLYGGVEASVRRIDWPVFERLEDRSEELYRAYLYWAPHLRWAVRAEFNFDRFKNDHEPEFEEFPQRVDTISVPVALRYFDPSGIFAEIGPTYVRHTVDRLRPTDLIVPKGSDEFVLLDASVGYRLPKRRGILSVEGLNLLDENFGYEDDNFRIAEPRNSRFIPGRTVVARVTLSF